ncbi:hypothetical protein FA95DRAFT_1613398 [Auriscalpium vulgare]|uniref:Uncharacterized protein n=1 Tax=Auriscalpium vulgare TaxID=40419 RepID=A0ACB8R2S0_9AGAM|nr:hypothetical protein FA95DRAFT_1613398 [Auriscalpium vulgare]
MSQVSRGATPRSMTPLYTSAQSSSSEAVDIRPPTRIGQWPTALPFHAVIAQARAELPKHGSPPCSCTFNFLKRRADEAEAARKFYAQWGGQGAHRDASLREFAVAAIILLETLPAYREYWTFFKTRVAIYNSGSAIRTKYFRDERYDRVQKEWDEAEKTRIEHERKEARSRTTAETTALQKIVKPFAYATPARWPESKARSEGSRQRLAASPSASHQSIILFPNDTETAFGSPMSISTAITSPAKSIISISSIKTIQHKYYLPPLYQGAS